MKVDVIYNKSSQRMTELPDESIDMIMTSPPYWGLRDYGEDVKEIWGGDPDCKHIFDYYNRPPSGGPSNPDKAQVGATKRGVQRAFKVKPAFCIKCGAWYGQLGLEPTFQLYLDHLMIVCAEIKRVLKKTGSFWLNMGDTYGGSCGGHGDTGLFTNSKRRKTAEYMYNTLKPQRHTMAKCLLGIPWRLVLRLIDEQGWILRNAIIWHKPNAMPSSVKDRCSNSYEFLFHLVKAKKYYYDLDAVREPHKQSSIERANYPVNAYAPERTGGAKLSKTAYSQYTKVDINPAGKNPGDVLIPPAKYRFKQNILSEHLAYIAGIIDGEGSIILRRKPKQNELFMVVVNTNKNIIKWLRKITKIGTIKQREVRNIKWRQVWEWNTAAENTTKILWAIYPYLIIKKEHAKIAIEYQSLAKHGGGPNRYTPAEKERREQLVKELGELNQGVRTKTTAPEPGEPSIIGIPRDLWRIPTQPRPEAHFATFSDKLCIKPILATCPAEICKKCGKARVRMREPDIGGTKGRSWHDHSDDMGKGNVKKQSGSEFKTYKRGKTIGWTDCGCNAGWDSGILLDPFAGRGTSLIMAKKLGRHYVGYELKKEYCEKLIRPALEEIDPLFDYIKPGGAASAL